MTGGRWRVLAWVVAALTVALGALYAAGAAGLLPGLAPSEQTAKPGNAVRAGFIGVLDYGHWHLICTPAPAPSVPAGSADAAPSKAPAGAANTCRLNQEVTAQENASRVIFAANFSLVGPRRKPAMMLRVPPTFHAGDAISLRFDGEQTIASAVRDCSANECVAASALSDRDWDRIVAARSMQIVFPLAGGQMAFVDLAVDGLAPAAAALAVAESISPP